jgi:UDP-N-acetylmuramoyl-tripeptide--D-alanyl-D-alanine ligase
MNIIFNEKMSAAHYKRNLFKKDIISVSGTNGKTTTTKLIYEILNKSFKVDKTHPNSNSLIGIPWCINKYFNLDSDYWIIEMGINKENEMDTLLALVKPNIRILTNIGKAHTSNFENDQGYINEKIKFIENNLEDNTILILNNYNKIIRDLEIKNKNITILTSGASKNDNVKILKYKLNDNNVSSYVEIETIKGIIKINYEGINKHMAQNICLAIVYPIYLNIPLNEIEENLNNFAMYNNRGNIIIKKKFILYNFSYNCNPTSINSNLQDFERTKSNNKLIILGDMYEIRNILIESNEVIKLCSKITSNIASESTKYNNILKEFKHNNSLISLNLNNLKKNLYNFIKNQKQQILIFIQGSSQSKMSEIVDYLNDIF